VARGASPSGGGRAAKIALAQQVNAIWDRLLSVHRATFPQVQPPIIPRPEVPDLEVLVAQRRKQAVRGIIWFKRTARRQARADAEAKARTEWQQADSAADAEQRRAQAEADAWWARLMANDPPTVLAQLADAFEDNESPAAPLDVTGSEVGIALLAPSDEQIPVRMGRVTAAGNPSLAKLAKGERGTLITAITMGFALVTIREAFAVAPGLTTARVVIVRVAAPDVAGKATLECVAAGRWSKDRLAAANWVNLDAGTIAIDNADELLLDIRGGAPQALDLSDQPELRTLVESIDMEELR